tara:strand:- start:253 stop:822 length:570 start_codon:yes stop_codon:yes gene_type:complete
MKHLIKKLLRESLLGEITKEGFNSKLYHGGVIPGIWKLEDFLSKNNLSSDKVEINNFFQKYIQSRVQDGFYWFTDDISTGREFAGLKSDKSGGGLLFLVEAESYAKNTFKTTWDEMEEMIYELDLNHFADLAPYLKQNTNYDSWFTDMKIMNQPYNDVCLFDKSLFKVTNVIFGNDVYNITPTDKSLWK